MSDCVLCQIVDGKLRAKVLYQDDLVLALDLPQDHPVRLAPVHFLVIPKEHLPSARETDTRHEPALGRLVTVAARIARDMGMESTGYRLASNTGDDAGQTVFHLHLHCLGGRKLGPEG
ncbi:MAG: HIT domain-containing protein [Deltaproteobacteria bacterium]|nr:HIT domain-containing protein [Deltaproteobacteria bacterium]